MKKLAKCLIGLSCFLMSLFFLSVQSLFAQTAPTYYYVAPNGNDANPGTESLPWKTLTKAASMATAGVTVFIRQGTYNEQLIPANSGSASEPITFSSYPGETVTITGAGIHFQPGPVNDKWWNGMIQIQDRDYIKISGLRVINSDGSGIAATGSNYITIERNYTDSTYSPGITAVQSDNIIVDANEVVRGCLGGDQECISLSGVHGFEIINNLVHNGFTEGIDVKVGSSNGIVSNNEVYNQKGPNRVPPGIYIDAWDSHEYNIDVFDNISHDNGIGLTVGSENGGLNKGIRIHHNKAYNNDRGFWLAGWGVATEKHLFNNIAIYGNEFYNNQFGIELGGYTGTNMDSIKVYNNLIHHNAHAGVRITRYDGPTGECVLKNVAIINNTIYGNGTLGNGWDAENTGMNIFNISPENLLIQNNIISNNDFCTIYVSPEVLSGTITIDYNFFDGFRNVTNEKMGTNAVFGNPLFVDSLNNDYHLQAASPAIDKGHPGQEYNDPADPDKPGYALYPAQGSLRNDMGAYGGPYASSWDLSSSVAPPSVPTLISPFNGAIGVPTTLLLGWDGPWGATSYQLQVSTNSDFSTLVVDSSEVIGQSCGIRDLENNTHYYWRVKATNAGGTSSWSTAWNFTTKDPSSLEESNPEIPVTYALYQNYPNPFSNSTEIWFAIPERNKVKMEVFDVSGKKIETLINEDLPPGYHKTIFEGKNYKDGIYICRIQAGNYKEVMKMVLIRK